MKKIRFAQPKYIIPLIIIPFNAFLFYMLKDSIQTEKEEKSEPEVIEEINTNIPMPNLDKRPLKSKFESFRETYKYNRDFTAMKDIDLRKDNKLSNKDKEVVDSVNNALILTAPKDFMSSVQARTGTYQLPKIQERKSKAKETEYDLQMRLFRDQMTYIDSISRIDEPSSGTGIEEKPDLIIKERIQQEIAQVTKQPKHASSFFQTIRANTKNHFIQAIIDEDIKVFPGSRVRIRLLEDIYAGDQHIEKGNYLYGTVTSFRPQRLEISISSVLVRDEILTVDLHVFDNDGLPGLYVPESQFREFTKDLTSNAVSGQNFQFSDTPQNQSEMLYDMAEKAFSTTTKTVSKSARKNKANLKYNTVLYLVNSNEY